MRPPTASTLHTSNHKCAIGVQNYLFNVSLAREIPKKFPISPRFKVRFKVQWAKSLIG